MTDPTLKMGREMVGNLVGKREGIPEKGMEGSMGVTEGVVEGCTVMVGL